MPTPGTLHDAFLDELRDAYDAELQVTKALPKMMKAATSPKLRAAFEAHLKETRGQVVRLEEVFAGLDEKVQGQHCDGMTGILEEGAAVMGEDLDETTMDACLIAAAQRIEHYEMAAYGTLVAWARSMDRTAAADLLEETLNEEKSADSRLSSLARDGINRKAAAAVAVPTRRRPWVRASASAFAVLTAGVVATACAWSGGADPADGSTPPAAEEPASAALVAEGKETFRFETFGDEQLWTDTLRLHQVVEESVDPTTALAVGLKVDADVLPAGILDTADLKSPATTVALLKMNAVVGLRATVDADGGIERIGVTCALCHSTVDNSVMPGIGRRLDGWPNRDLNVGAIIALSPALSADQKAVYNSWGPGKYDPRYNLDGKNTPLVIPPAYGLAGVTNETYTAEGPISYWNAYVAVTQMGGRGNFADTRLGIDVSHSPDLVTPKLAALRAYQHSLPSPAPPAGSFDAVAAERGRRVFDRTCGTCHVGGSGTDNNSGTLHAPADTGVDGAYAARTANKAYRTTPLRALWQHPPYFHDGSAATLADVVTHYNRVRALSLTPDQQRDLVEYLKSR